MGFLNKVYNECPMFEPPVPTTHTITIVVSTHCYLVLVLCQGGAVWWCWGGHSHMCAGCWLLAAAGYVTGWDSVLGWLPTAMEVANTDYSKTLAGIFQTILNDNKRLMPAVDEFIEKSQKLETQLKTTILIFSSFNDSLLKVAEKGNNLKKGK